LLSKTLSSCSLVLSGFGFSPQAEVGYQDWCAAMINQVSINFEV